MSFIQNLDQVATRESLIAIQVHRLHRHDHRRACSARSDFAHDVAAASSRRTGRDLQRERAGRHMRAVQRERQLVLPRDRRGVAHLVRAVVRVGQLAAHLRRPAQVHLEGVSARAARIAARIAREHFERDGLARYGVAERAALGGAAGRARRRLDTVMVPM